MTSPAANTFADSAFSGSAASFWRTTWVSVAVFPGQRLTVMSQNGRYKQAAIARNRPVRGRNKDILNESLTKQKDDQVTVSKKEVIEINDET